MKKILTGILLVGLFSVMVFGPQASFAPAYSSDIGDEFLVQEEYAIYAKLDGVDGEATDLMHEKWIVLDSVLFGEHQPEGASTGATRRRGNVILDDIQCTKELDKSTPKIAEGVCKGKVFPKVEIEVTRVIAGNPVTVYKYELINVVFTSLYSQASTSDSPHTYDTFTMSYEEITTTYSEYDAEGNRKGNVEWKYVSD